VSKHSRDKGKRGELEAAKLLQSYGFSAKRGQQHAGGADSQDVKHDMEGFHIEVKRTETLSLYEAMGQAMDDTASTGKGEIPLVLHRRNNKPWLVVMLAEDFLKIARDELYDFPKQEG
jgi:Holliday junction resolvase